MMWRSWKNVCWRSGGCWSMHTVIAAAIAQCRSRLNACVRVNCGYFEHKFWASDFLLCFVCFIDTGFCKCDRCKHVQSANIGVKCVTFVSKTFTWYGSNITNVWQEILLRSCDRKLWKSVNICKRYSKKISGTFFIWTRCITYCLYTASIFLCFALFNVQLLHIAYSFELSDSCIYLESWQPFTTETRWACKLASPKLMYSTIVDNWGWVPGYYHEFLGGRGSEG